jgi:hypothetical protein
MLDRLQVRADALAVTVTVGGRPWRQVADLSSAGPAAGVFVLTVDAAGAAHIQFGNGVQGQRPPAGAAIDVAYRSSAGADGRVGSVAPLGGGVSGLVLVLPANPAAGGFQAVGPRPRPWPPR